MEEIIPPNSRESTGESERPSLLEAALEYAELGYPVFPLYGVTEDGTTCLCPAGATCGGNAGKHPRTPNGFKDATTDPRQIRAWWAAYPMSNIGVTLIGTEALVTDLDCKDPAKDGFVTWRALTGDLALPETPQSVTPSGGLHYWWDVSDCGELKYGTNTLGPGVDTPNYVVAPPSRTPKGEYRWVRDYSVLEMVATGLPRQLAARLVKDAAEKALPTAGPAANADGELSKYTERGLRYAEELGSRVQAAFKLAGYCRDTLRVEEPVALAIVQTFVAVANRVMPKDHPIPPGDVVTQVRNAYKWPRRDPVDGGIKVVTFPGAQDAGEETSGPKFVARTRGELKLLPKPEWLVHDILLRQGVSFIGGDSGTGKTFLALDIALCIAHGIPFHGREVRQGPVIYIAGEDVEGLDGRITAWEQAHGYSDSPNFYYIDTAPQLIDRAEVAAVIVAIESLGLSAPPAIIFLDTLATSLVGVEENSAKETGAAMAAVAMLPKRFGCQTVMLHHTPKNGSGLRGSGTFRASANTQIEVSKEDESSVLLVRNPKQKNGAPTFKPFNLTLRAVVLDEEEGISAAVLEDKDGPLTIPAKSSKGGNSKFSENDVAACLQDGMTFAEWQQAAKDRLGMSSAAFSRHRRALVQGKLVFVGADNRYRKLDVRVVEDKYDTRD